MSNRKTFNFTPKTVADVAQLKASLGLNETDIANHSIQFRARMDTLLSQGYTLALVAPDGTVEKIHIL